MTLSRRLGLLVCVMICVTAVRPAGAQPDPNSPRYKGVVALEALLENLALANPHMMAELANKIPQPGPRMATTLLALLAIFRGGNMRGRRCREL